MPVARGIALAAEHVLVERLDVGSIALAGVGALKLARNNCGRDYAGMGRAMGQGISVALQAARVGLSAEHMLVDVWTKALSLSVPVPL